MTVSGARRSLDGRLHTAATMAPLLTSLISGYRSRGGNMDNMDNILGSSRRSALAAGLAVSGLGLSASHNHDPRVSHDPTHPSEVESYLPASQ